VAVAKKAERTAYDLPHCRNEPSKMPVSNNHRHVMTTLSMAIPDAEILSVQFSVCVLWLNVASYSKSLKK